MFVCLFVVGSWDDENMVRKYWDDEMNMVSKDWDDDKNMVSKDWDDDKNMVRKCFFLVFYFKF